MPHDSENCIERDTSMSPTRFNINFNPPSFSSRPESDPPLGMLSNNGVVASVVFAAGAVVEVVVYSWQTAYLPVVRYSAWIRVIEWSRFNCEGVLQRIRELIFATVR